MPYRCRRPFSFQVAGEPERWYRPDDTIDPDELPPGVLAHAIAQGAVVPIPETRSPIPETRSPIPEVPEATPSGA
jgi:hypothetical protein